jgi:uncharacterized protein YecT (DUF1311 family)
VSVRIPILLPLAGAMWLAGAVSAFAQDVEPTVEDRARFQGCLADTLESEASAEKCRDVVSRPCMDEPQSQSTYGMNACMVREQRLWDEMLNDEYGRLRRGLAPELAGELRDVQRAWIAYRDVKCLLVREVIEGTIASNIAGACMLETVARRAIELQDLRKSAGLGVMK